MGGGYYPTDENGYIGFIDSFKNGKKLIHKGKPTSLKSKQRLSWMLQEHLGSNVVYIDVTSNGIIGYVKKISICSEASIALRDLFTVGPSGFDGSCLSYRYILTSKCKVMRFKNVSCTRYESSERKGGRKKSKKAKPLLQQHKNAKIRRDKTHKREIKSKPYPTKQGISDTKSEENFEIEIFHKNKRDGKKKIETTYDSEEEDTEEEDSNALEVENYPRNEHWKLKKLPKTLSYLYSDAYLKPRHSKRYVEELKCYMSEDITFCPLKSLIPGKPEKQRPDDKEEENGYTCGHTFGMFFTKENLTKLGLDDSFKSLKKYRSNHSQGTELISTDSFEFIDKKEVENASEKLGSISQVVDIHKEAIDIVKTNRHAYGEYRCTETEKDESTNVIVILPHSTLRPDILNCEFKEDYKEASCKKRRFILNISHLAYQHLIRLNLLPFDIISQTDISMYLVFVYLNEVNNDTDRYKLWINSSFPLNKPVEIFHELVQKKLTSIHEIIHATLSAFNDPELNKVLMNQKDYQQEYFDKYPSCTFHLLHSVRLKLRLKIANQASTSAKNVQNSTFSHNPSNKKRCDAFSDISFSSSIVRNGPSESSICGVCLKSFDDKCIYPIALVVCSHWFCEECWKSNLCVQMKAANHEHFICMERDCNSVIDLITLISIFDLQLIQKFHKRKNILYTFQDPLNQNCCTNVSCRKSLSEGIIDIQTFKCDEFMPIVCSCSWQYCPKCFENPHWPANCDISNIYYKCLEAQGLDTFNRCAKDDELPDLVLRGKSCPQCGTFIQEKNEKPKREHCSCGCVFCWPCGKKVILANKDEHIFCIERFELSDKKLKDKVLKCSSPDVSKTQISRWFKVALTHRQMRHPQVVKRLYDMADQVATRINTALDSGKHCGVLRSAAMGWNPVLRKLNWKQCKQFEISNDFESNWQRFRESPTNTDDLKTSSLLDSSNIDTGRPSNDFNFSKMQPTISLSSPTSRHNDIPIKTAPNSLITRAACNIVHMKLEIHHIIEHMAVMLEFDHSLSNSQNIGKIIRSLEHAEDLCEGLGLLLQDPHNEKTPRIIPTLIRLRMQANNMLSALHYYLKLE